MFRSAMGTEHGTRTRLITRCCQGASFGFGFVFTVLTLITMFWIAWCYFGLTIIQISDTQRRAIVNYSYASAKPSPTPTSAPVRSTTSATEETSINSIFKSPTTQPVLRGSSRGEIPAKVEKKKEPELVSSFAKGDFASRDRSPGSSSSDYRGSSTSSVLSPRGPSRPSDDKASEHRAAILSGTSSEESDDDRIYARRVLPPGAENRPEDTSEAGSRRSDPASDTQPDISPTKVYEVTGTRSTEPEVDRNLPHDGKTGRREYVERDVVPSARRDDDRRFDTDRREIDSDREYPRRPSADRDRSRYDDVYDDKRSRSRYDRRDREQDSDDRYSKGDTRVYTDRVRERYPEDIPKRFDDRYRDYDDQERSRDRDYIKPRDRISDDRTPLRDEKYKDDDRYVRTKDDDRYVLRDDDRYISRGDDRYRKDERYRPRDDARYRDDERYRSRADDRYKEDDRYRPRSEDRKDDRYRSDDDDRYVTRDDDRYRSRDDDRYRTRDDDRYRSRDDDRYRIRDEDDRYRARGTSKDDDRYISVSRTVDEKDRVRPRDDERDIESRRRDDDIRQTASRNSDLPPLVRPSPVARNYESVRDYDVEVREPIRGALNPSRHSRPLPDDDRYIETNKRPSRYDDDDDRRISPTRAVVADSNSRSSVVGSRLKDIPDDARYTESERGSRRRDDNRYVDQDDRFRNTRIQDSRGVESSSNSRRVVDDRDGYQTRLPGERTERNENSREEVVLDRRSYAAEEEYRRQNSRSDTEDRSRRPSENTRPRYRDDERYVPREPAVDEKTRDSYDYDKTRSRDRYEDRYDKPARDEPPLPLRKYDPYDDEEERNRPRDSDLGTLRKEESDGRLRSRGDDRYYDRDTYPDSRPSSRRTYDDDKDSYDDDRRRPGSSRRQSRPREPVIGSSMTPVHSREPDDVVTREKRFQNEGNKQQSSRVTSMDTMDRGSESRSRDALRPLSAKDVIEAAMRHSDTKSQNSRNVYYPVFDPRVTNLTSPEMIRQSERRGTTITAKKKRKAFRRETDSWALSRSRVKSSKSKDQKIEAGVQNSASTCSKITQEEISHLNTDYGLLKCVSLKIGTLVLTQESMEPPADQRFPWLSIPFLGKEIEQTESIDLSTICHRTAPSLTWQETSEKVVLDKALWMQLVPF